MTGEALSVVEKGCCGGRKGRFREVAPDPDRRLIDAAALFKARCLCG